MPETGTAETYQAALEAAGYRYADFSPDEQACIAGKMRAMEGEDRPQAQQVALAIKGCAPGKARPEKAAAAYQDAPLGGQHDAEQAADGTWTLRDVPILLDHYVRRRDGKLLKVGAEWMARAVAKAQARAVPETEGGDGFLGPLHINHHGTGRDVGDCGRFRPTRVGTLTYEGRQHQAIYADLVGIPDAVYQRIKAQRLPYLSPEILDLATPEVSSVALMADEVPFFRRMVTVGRETPAQRFAAPQAPAVAYRATGSGAGYALLYHARYSHMPDEKPPVDDRDVVVNVGDDEDEGEMLRGIAEKLSAMAAKMMAKKMQAGEEKPVEPPLPIKEQARPAPVLAARAGAPEASYALMARLDAAEAELAGLRAERARRKTDAEREAAVGTLVRDLAAKGIQDARYAARVRELAEKHGIAAAAVYAETVCEHACAAPAPWTGDVPAAAFADPIAAKYAAGDPREGERARKAALEFDELAAHGFGVGATKEEYVAAAAKLAANGTGR